MSDNKKGDSARSEEKKSKKKKNVWKIPNFEDRCRQLIGEGLLMMEGGEEKLCQLLNEEFKEELAAEELKLSKFGLLTRMPTLIWTKNADEALKQGLKFDPNLVEFRENFNFIPDKWIQRQVRWRKGVSNLRNPAKFLRGWGRLTDEVKPGDENFDLPENSLEKPFVVEVKNPSRFTFMVINGTNIGIQYDPNIEDNLARTALADAQTRGDEAVILTNILDLDHTKSAGNMKILRAMISGLNNPKPEEYETSYQEEARMILEKDTSKGYKPEEDVLYKTISERFLSIARGWGKISHRPNKTPEYRRGPALIILTYKEEQLISAAADRDLGYKNKKKQDKIERQIKAANAALADAIINKNYKQIDKLNEKLDRLEKLKSRAIITNIDDKERQEAYRKMLAYVVRQLEAAIPHSKVIGMGTTYVKFGNECETFEFSIPNNINVTDGRLADYCDTHGGKVLRGAMPRNVIICDPHALNYRMTAREMFENGERKSCQIHVAPALLDDGYLRWKLRNTIRSVHKIQDVVFSEQTRTGVLRVEYFNKWVQTDDVPAKALDTYKGKDLTIMRHHPYPDNKFIYFATATDIHMGGRAREYIWCDERQEFLGVCEAGIQMMRQSGLLRPGKGRIHFFNINDDIVQGRNYETQLQPDPKQIEYYGIEKYWKESNERIKVTKDLREAVQIFQQMQKFNLRQFLIRGYDWTQHQISGVFEQHINRDLDFYDSVLRTFLNAELTLKGVSDFEGTADTRDVGVINDGSGNHFANTVDQELTEGFIFAYYQRALLQSLPHWRGKEALLKRLVKSPLYSNKFFAWGTVQSPGGYEYGLAFSGSPTRMEGWGDTLRGVIHNEQQRGDYTHCSAGRYTLQTYGDKHFFCQGNTAMKAYHMCAANTHTDQYGELGFPMNNTGISFVGLPVMGPNSGPILLRTLHYEFLKKYFENPFEFDWDAFLPNPA